MTIRLEKIIVASLKYLLRRQVAVGKVEDPRALEAELELAAEEAKKNFQRGRG